MLKIISIEGNIGSGKSTVINSLKQLYSISNKIPKIYFLEEPVSEWETFKDCNGKNIIEKFYADQKKYSFSFQMMAYISRLSMLKNAIKECNKNENKNQNKKNTYTNKSKKKCNNIVSCVKEFFKL